MDNRWFGSTPGVIGAALLLIACDGGTDAGDTAASAGASGRATQGAAAAPTTDQPPHAVPAPPQADVATLPQAPGTRVVDVPPEVVPDDLGKSAPPR